jgi:hypothetical protein
MKLKTISLWVLPVAMAVVAVPALSARQAAKTVYATFLDPNGVPITDLAQEEIHVAENGKEVQVVSAKRATTPMSIILLGDSTKAAGGSGMAQGGKGSSGTAAGDVMVDIRAALNAFSQELLSKSPESELTLVEFGQANVTIVPYTSKLEDVAKGITHLVSKPDADSVLFEAITEGSKDLGKRKNARHAIISINVEPSNEVSKEPPNTIMKELGKAQAPLFSVSLQKGTNKNNQRGVVLPQLASQTGGRHEVIVGQSALVDMLKQTADYLLAQYEITYTRPAGPMPGAIQFGVSGRQGVKILATKFPPQ